MNSIVKALKAMEAEAGKSGRWNLETLCKMAALEIDVKSARIAKLETHVEDANTAATSLQIQNAKLIEKNARLTAGSEAMQEDARNNTATIKAQAEEIFTLKGIAANLAKHLESIQNICERGDEFIPTEVGRAIRKHCEAANVMESL